MLLHLLTLLSARQHNTTMVAVVQLPSSSPFDADMSRQSSSLELRSSFHNLSCRMSSRLLSAMSHAPPR